jgi:hypothetical protein
LIDPSVSNKIARELSLEDSVMQDEQQNDKQSLSEQTK